MKIKIDKKKKRKIFIIAGGSILGILLIAVTVYGVNRIPPNFDKLSDEKVLEYMKSGKSANLDNARLVKLGERLDKIPSEKRREGMDSLTSGERDNLRESRMLIADAAMKKTIDEFFSLPADKQNEFLDKQIRQMEERRREFFGRFGREGFPAGGREGGERRQNVEGQSGSGTGERVGGQSGAGGPRARRSPEVRLQMRRNRLSEVSPEDRAKRREYFHRLMERRREMRRRG